MDWGLRSHPLGSGSRTLQWSNTKDASGSASSLPKWQRVGNLLTCPLWAVSLVRTPGLA